MLAIGRQPQRAPDGASGHYERHRPEQTTLDRLVQQHAATFIAQAEDAAGADLPQFVKAEFDAFLECGILAHGFRRLRCDDCGPDKLAAFSCKRRGFCPSCGARRMAQTAAHLIDHVIPMCRCASGCSRPPLRRLCGPQDRFDQQLDESGLENAQHFALRTGYARPWSDAEAAAVQVRTLPILDCPDQRCSCLLFAQVVKVNFLHCLGRHSAYPPHRNPSSSPGACYRRSVRFSIVAAALQNRVASLVNLEVVISTPSARHDPRNCR